MEMAADRRRAKSGDPQYSSFNVPHSSPEAKHGPGKQSRVPGEDNVLEEWQAELLTQESEEVASVISSAVQERSPAKEGTCFLDRSGVDAYVRACGVATAPYRTLGGGSKTCFGYCCRSTSREQLPASVVPRNEEGRGRITDKYVQWIDDNETRCCTALVQVQQTTINKIVSGKYTRLAFLPLPTSPTHTHTHAHTYIHSYRHSTQYIAG